MEKSVDLQKLIDEISKAILTLPISDQNEAIITVTSYIIEERSNMIKSKTNELDTTKESLEVLKGLIKQQIEK